MNQLVLTFFFILFGCKMASGQVPYAPNERVVLVNDPARRNEYIMKAQQVLRLADGAAIVVSKNNPALLLIRATSVAQLDKVDSPLSQLGKAFPNWIELPRSTTQRTMYCIPCGKEATSAMYLMKKAISPIGRVPDQNWRFSKSKQSAISDSVTCCPKANSRQLQPVVVITKIGPDKATIAELLEEASRLTADRTVMAVRLASSFPPEAAPLLAAFGQQLKKQTNAVLQPIGTTSGR